MKHLKLFLCAAMAAVLLGCGGGGGSAGTSSAGTGGANSVDATVVSFPISVDKASLSNSGSDKVTLTVTALDVNNNPVAGVSVKGSVDSGVYTPGSKVTDATGKFTATVEIGADKMDRTIVASVMVNGVTKSVTIPVTGSQFKLTPVPATPAPGQAIRLDIRVSDALGTAIPGVSVLLSGTAGFSGTATTDLTGSISVNALAPATAGIYGVTASGSGVTSATSIQVIVPGGNTLPDASLGANSSGVAFTIDQIAGSLTANPTSIAPNTPATLSAKFLNPSNGGVKNMRVRFEIVPPGLGSGESISTGTNFVPTDESGLAEAKYLAGTRTSPTNGVQVRVCYATTDAGLQDPISKALLCPNFKVASLTVNSQPLDISIGDDNKLTVGLGGVAYLKKFLIQVADASGVAVKDAVVSASLDITHFGKGPNWGSGYYPTQVPDINWIYGYNYGTVSNPVTYDKNQDPNVAMNVWCVNEDTNRNGTLDVGEDINGDGTGLKGNGVLDPGKSGVVLSYVSGNKTDENGQLLVQISYPQNVGRWLAYTIKATTSVVGSEGKSARSFVTDVLEADVKNGSFLTPPFGKKNCLFPD